MTIKKKVNFFQIFLLFFVKWLWNLHNPVQDRELPKNVLILSQNIENKWKKSFSEESKLCPCWGTVCHLPPPQLRDDNDGNKMLATANDQSENNDDDDKSIDGCVEVRRTPIFMATSLTMAKWCNLSGWHVLPDYWSSLRQSVIFQNIVKKTYLPGPGWQDS